MPTVRMTTTALRRNTETTRARTVNLTLQTAPTSRSIPTEMKNRLLKTFLNGRISETTWWLYSDSARTTPARNAPKASDSPSNEVRRAMPRQMKSVAMRKTSRMRVLTTRWRTRGMRKRARTKAVPMARALNPNLRTMAPSETLWTLARTGTRAIMGTMARPGKMGPQADVGTAGGPW